MNLIVLATYEAISDWDPASADDLLGAHGLLMRGLCDDAGHWRVTVHPDGIDRKK